ncbi:MAG: hypothetical protein LBM28_01070 [Oscillospiraceae bacterium]|jgi:hypothetical protein|nr:hypothetical protein [Oscillospiraceae bacterium]
MKRGIVLLLLATALLTACTSGSGTDYAQTPSPAEAADNYAECIFSMNRLNVYQSEDVYHVVIESGYGGLDRSITFDARRNANDPKGITPIACGDISKWLGKTMREVEEEYGEIEVELGSGLYLPGYITTDAYLLTFSPDGQEGKIEMVSKTDLFSGEVSERYFLEEDS